MPIDFKLSIAASLLLAMAVTAQETPTPTATPSPSPVPTATPAPTRSVRISFLPPPLEGTISLGIYDGGGRLVRILHQEAELDEFTLGADALVTKWDGKNDDGEDLPRGKYRARGFLVAQLKLENLGKAATLPPDDPVSVQIKLVANPLASNAKAIVDLGVGFDDENSFLKTMDGLPLYTISQSTNLVRALITKNGEKSVDVWQDDGSAVEQIRVSNIDKMMAFDCGEFELK